MRVAATLFKPNESVPTYTHVYGPRYADHFAANARHHAPDAEVVIVSDYDPDDFTQGQTIIPFALEHRGWAALLEMFRPEVVGERSAVLVGLDTIFVGHLEGVEYAVDTHNMVATYDGCSHRAPVMTNAVIGVSPDAAADIWSAWVRERARALTTDKWFLGGRMGGWFSEMLWLRERFKGRWRDIDAGRKLTYCYKGDRIADRGVPTGASIIYFHGDPKPHHLTHSWVMTDWVRPLFAEAEPE